MKAWATIAILFLAAPLVIFALSAHGFHMLEPGSVALLALGFVGLGLARRRARAGANSAIEQ